MFLALVIAAFLGIIAGAIAHAFASTRPYTGLVGILVAGIAFFVQLGLLG